MISDDACTLRMHGDMLQHFVHDGSGSVAQTGRALFLLGSFMMQIGPQVPCRVVCLFVCPIGTLFL